MSFRRKGGGGGGGVCTANWCDYDIFLPQKTSAGELVLVKDAFQGRRGRRRVDVFQERRMWRGGWWWTANCRPELQSPTGGGRRRTYLAALHVVLLTDWQPLKKLFS